MRLRILGPLRGWRQKEPVELGPFKQRAVLAALLLKPGQPVAHDEIIEFVWGEDIPASAVNLVQTYVRRLRDVLEPGRTRRGRRGLLNTLGAGCYSVQAGEDDLDLLRFRAIAEQASLAEAPGERLDLLIEALNLWQGPCLHDLGESWQRHPWVRAVNQERISAVLSAADAARRCGRVAETVAPLRAVAADEPLNEPVHAHLLMALVESGEEAEAVACYERISRGLANEFGVDPSPGLRNAYQEVVARVVSLQKPGQVMEPVTWRGPRPLLGGLVGREADLTGVAGLVRERRVVTLIGPGGVGKTALALIVANRLADRHSGGVAVVELGPLPAARPDGGRGEQLDVLAETICTLLGAPVGSLGPVEALTRAVRDQSMLLVLDNAEHVTPVVAHLVEHLVGAADRVRMLVTSRHPLGIADETVWEVEPLPVPPGDGDDDPLGYAAVELYLRRAEQHCPTLDLSDSLPIVSELSRRVDGLPLGIELIAGRLRSISPAMLLERIDEWLGVLSRPGEHGLPHQRTLAATVQWSIDMLEPAERLLLSRLAVFAGSFDLEAAERVAGFGDLGASRVAVLLTGLIDHSLVHVIRCAEYRYRILAPIRKSCLELADAADLFATRDRHLTFYRELGDTLVNGSPQDGAAVLAWLRAESADVSAAVEWGLRPNAEPKAVNDSVGLLTAAALAMVDSHQAAGRRRRADILLGLASIIDALLHEDAADRARHAVGAAHEVGDLRHIVAAHAGAAVILAWREHHTEAERCLDRAFEAAKSTGAC
ncbi:BTAD domain-containing putative transcriptional regulator [Nonomuraea sp. KM90]|uniref:BTAD domain-containing putative transcriptional regulator n=1 Tax=Nonomuraea sp. KM90 TaxID=3457428 RepID=UPI003FCD3C50